MSENEKRVRTKELVSQIEKIAEITKNLREIVDSLPSSGVKDAYELSTKNLEKKTSNFLAVSEKISGEEKEIALLIRQGKFDEAERRLSAIRANREKSNVADKKDDTTESTNGQGGSELEPTAQNVVKSKKIRK